MTTGKGVEVPAALARALDAAPGAREAFGRMPPSHQREHASYVAEAKQEATRDRRAHRTVASVLAWAKGRPDKPK